MLFASLLASALTCAAAAAAEIDSVTHPTGSGDHTPHRSSRVQLLQQPGGNVSHGNMVGKNWAGAVYHGYESGSFRHVSATVVVPSAVKLPTGGNNAIAYFGTAWVGIDGFSSCSDAILQTGVNWVLQGGQVKYNAWYQWFPASSFLYSAGFVVRAGDTLRLTVDSGTPKSGVATVENLTTGKSVSQSLTSNVELCAADAEWIVEDQGSSNGTTSPFANFGSVTFTAATTIVNAGAGGSLGPVYASLVDIQQGSILTQSTSTDTTVKVNYIG